MSARPPTAPRPPSATPAAGTITAQDTTTGTTADTATGTTIGMTVDTTTGTAADAATGTTTGAATGTAIGTTSGTATDTATDVIRWAAFSCVLVPVVLVGYGTSLAGAAGTALGLAAVTGACRVLLRRSEHGAALPRARERTPHHGRHGGTAAGERRGDRRTGADTPVD